MKMGHVEVPVSDPAASKAFYVDLLGFELAQDQGGIYLWLTSGDFVLLLRPGPPRPGGGADETHNLVLYADDADARAETLRAAGVEIELRGTCWYFQDPDGHWFQLVDPNADHSGG